MSSAPGVWSRKQYPQRRDAAARCSGLLLKYLPGTLAHRSSFSAVSEQVNQGWGKVFSRRDEQSLMRQKILGDGAEIRVV